MLRLEVFNLRGRTLSDGLDFRDVRLRFSCRHSGKCRLGLSANSGRALFTGITGETYSRALIQLAGPNAVPNWREGTLGERRRPEPDSMSSPIPSSVALFWDLSVRAFQKARDLRNGKAALNAIAKVDHIYGGPLLAGVASNSSMLLNQRTDLP